jgi:hypothetical protein
LFSTLKIRIRRKSHEEYEKKTGFFAVKCVPCGAMYEYPIYLYKKVRITLYRRF